MLLLYMNILESIFSKSEKQNTRVIGNLETSRDQIIQALLGTMSAMGMANPTSIVTKARKSVKIKKRGKNYLITLYSFNPPLEIVWSPLVPAKNLLDFIEKVSNEERSIGYYSSVINDSGEKSIQFALVNSPR